MASLRYLRRQHPNTRIPKFYVGVDVYSTWELAVARACLIAPCVITDEDAYIKAVAYTDDQDQLYYNTSNAEDQAWQASTN